jgi:hypothetical protein
VERLLGSSLLSVLHTCDIRLILILYFRPGISHWPCTGSPCWWYVSAFLLFRRTVVDVKLPSGLAAHYSSWRTMQFILFFCGLSAFVLIYAFFPETSHPRAGQTDKSDETVQAPAKRRKWVWLNPFKPLYLLRSPNLMIIVCTPNSLPSPYLLPFVWRNRHLRALSFCSQITVRALGS